MIPSDRGFANTLEGVAVIIGLKAGPLSQWLHRGLTDAGLGVVVGIAAASPSNRAGRWRPVSRDRARRRTARAIRMVVIIGSARFPSAGILRRRRDRGAGDDGCSHVFRSRRAFQRPL